MFGADPQRTGWAVHETMLNRNNVGTLELKWKIRLDNAPKELTSLTAPIVVDQSQNHPQGIKEYVVVAGSSDTIFAIDADTGKLVWQQVFHGRRASRFVSPMGSVPSRSMPLPRHRPPDVRRPCTPFPATEGFTL